jgi:hypothetical protein
MKRSTHFTLTLTLTLTFGAPSATKNVLSIKCFSAKSIHTLKMHIIYAQPCPPMNMTIQQQVPSSNTTANNDPKIMETILSINPDTAMATTS